MFDLSYKIYSDIAQKRCASIVTDQVEGGQIKFLVPLLRSRYEAGFLRILYYQNCLRLGLSSNSWVSYYFLMSDRQHAYLYAQPSKNMRFYRSSTVLYNTIFDIKTLESYELENCFGINIKKLQKTSVNNNSAYKKVHLVWLEPRKDTIHQLEPRAFIEFRFLVTQMMHKPTGLTTKFLDRFFDNYKQDILQLGISESTRSGDLSQEQFYGLFLYLKRRGDYETSTFLQAAARAEDIVFTL